MNENHDYHLHAIEDIFLLSRIRMDDVYNQIKPGEIVEVSVSSDPHLYALLCFSMFEYIYNKGWFNIDDLNSFAETITTNLPDHIKLEVLAQEFIEHELFHGVEGLNYKHITSIEYYIKFRCYESMNGTKLITPQFSVRKEDLNASMLDKLIADISMVTNPIHYDSFLSQGDLDYYFNLRIKLIVLFITHPWLLLKYRQIMECVSFIDS